MNVVIVAGGLGTRYHELSVFPKILLATRFYNSLLTQDVDIFKNHKISLIINEKYYDMTLDYITVNNIDINLVKSSNVNGSYNTIKSVYDKIPHDNVLFIWSDLEIFEDFSHQFENDTIICHQGHYRYVFENNKIRLSDNKHGNVPGIYFLKNTDKYFTHELDEISNYDLIDCLMDSNQMFDCFDIDKNNIVEYRDKDSYVHLMHKINPIDMKMKTRFFNKISTIIDENTGEIKLKKQAIVKDYYPIIRKEFDWYKKMRMEFDEKKISKIIPITDDKMCDDDTSFVMEFLSNWDSLHAYVKSHNEEDVQQVYRKIKRHLMYLSTVYNYVSHDQFAEDLKYEVIDKVLSRCNKIKNMLVKYDAHDLENRLNMAYQYLLSTEPNTQVRYCVCHGDLNGSNAMVNPKNHQVKFIDPRGYFGKTTFYGWQPYEYAKLLYCLSGYDDFNNLPQIYGMDFPKKLEYYDKIDYLNNKQLRVLVGIIWIALAGYISQDIMKANIAYEYGLDFLQQALDEKE